MKLSQLALAAALAVGWALLPASVRANNDGEGGDEETIEIHKRIAHDDREGGRGERRADMEGREGMEGPRGPRAGDAEMKLKFEKVRELEVRARKLALIARRGPEAEKAAAKVEARKVLGELFDAKLVLETAMLEKMEKRAAELKAKIARKQSGREKAIESRLARMTGEGDEW